MSRKKEVTVFINGVTWQHEAGEDADGSRIYYSMKQLKKEHDLSGDGVVRCKLVFDGWVLKQDPEKMIATAKDEKATTEEMIRNVSERIEKDKKYLEALKDELSNLSKS